MVSDFAEKLALNESDPAFDRGFVFWFFGSGRQHRKAPMVGELNKALVDVRIVDVGLGDARF